MTEATPKTTTLTGEEFKTLAITNVVQLQNWLQSIPGHVESGSSGLSAEHLALIDNHLNRCRMFLRSWSLTKVAVAPVQVEQPAGDTKPNGAEASKGKGGWPKGKKRTRTPATPPVGQL